MMPALEVLVASSELESRLHLRDILTKLGIDPICLPTIRDCHESMAQRQIGLIFCDTHLADGTYMDLLSFCRGRESKPRVVVTSRLADWDEFKEALRRGAFDLIASPCRPTDVEWMLIQAKRDERSRQKTSDLLSLPALRNTAAARAQDATLGATDFPM